MKRKMNPFEIEGRKCFTVEYGNTQIIKKNIFNGLRRLNLQEVNQVQDCDVIFCLCLIVSRAGTDADAALKRLNRFSESKPAFFIMLYHSFDPEKVLPDNSRYIQRENTLTVNCLYSEDCGLLTCETNNKALKGINACFKQSQVSCFFMRPLCANVRCGWQSFSWICCKLGVCAIMRCGWQSFCWICRKLGLRNLWSFLGRGGNAENGDSSRTNEKSKPIDAANKDV